MKIHSISVSLGAKALPEVQEAIAHAQTHPEHDPIVFMRVLEDGKSVNWLCRECMGLEGY